MAQDNVYTPVLVGETIRWTVPQISMANGCWTDEMMAFHADSGEYELWYKNRPYDMDIFWGMLYASEDNARLYIHPVESNGDFLIMDLNLSVNDTFNTRDEYGSSLELIVDSVFVKNGRKHVCFNRCIGTGFGSYQQERMMFIEGVGPNWGLREREVIYASPFYFICKYNGDSLCYAVSDEVFENCDFRSPCNDAIEEEKLPSPSIYPNPFSVSFMVECSEANTQFLIYDEMGRVCLKKHLLTGSYFIDMQKYPSGYYIACFIHNNSRKFKKIVKNN